MRPGHRLDHRHLLPHGRRMDRRVKGTQPMTTHTQPPAGGETATTEERSSIVKVVFASLVGTAVEWYDFFLYGSAAALVFGTLFFPESDPVTATPIQPRMGERKTKKLPVCARNAPRVVVCPDWFIT